MHWFEAGHGGGGTEQAIALQERLLGFARQVLERGQKEVPLG